MNEPIDWAARNEIETLAEELAHPGTKLEIEVFADGEAYLHVDTSIRSLDTKWRMWPTLRVAEDLETGKLWGY